MANVVRIREISGWMNRVPRGLKPEVEVELADNEHIINFELRQAFLDPAERVTVDWHWTAWVVVE